MYSGKGIFEKCTIILLGLLILLQAFLSGGWGVVCVCVSARVRVCVGVCGCLLLRKHFGRSGGYTRRGRLEEPINHKKKGEKKKRKIQWPQIEPTNRYPCVCVCVRIYEVYLYVCMFTSVCYACCLENLSVSRVHKARPFAKAWRSWALVWLLRKRKRRCGSALR